MSVLEAPADGYTIFDWSPPKAIVDKFLAASKVLGAEKFKAKLPKSVGYNWVHGANNVRALMKPFHIGTTAVTNREFEIFINDTGYTTDVERFG